MYKMEKGLKHKNNTSFLKLLSNGGSVISFQNPPFSPGRDHLHKAHQHSYKGFSGPINFAELPDEAREKPKHGEYDYSGDPTSPKVSCMGQITYKNKNKKDSRLHGKKKNKNSSIISKFFRKTSNKNETVSQENYENDKIKERVIMPSLGHMRKFASGRETLSNFDWTAQIAPIDHHRNCFSDDDVDEDEDEGGKEKVIIPFSAPMLLGGGSVCKLEPLRRNEVNLWKRRTMNPPPPLALNSKV